MENAALVRNNRSGNWTGGASPVRVSAEAESNADNKASRDAMDRAVLKRHGCPNARLVFQNGLTSIRKLVKDHPFKMKSFDKQKCVRPEN